MTDEDATDWVLPGVATGLPPNMQAETATPAKAADISLPNMDGSTLPRSRHTRRIAASRRNRRDGGRTPHQRSFAAARTRARASASATPLSPWCWWECEQTRIVSHCTSACCASRLARGNASGSTHSEASSNYLCTNDGAPLRADCGMLAGPGRGARAAHRAVRRPDDSTARHRARGLTTAPRPGAGVRSRWRPGRA